MPALSLEGLVVSSTTDTQEQVNAAVGIETPEEEVEEKPVAQETAAETDSDEGAEEEAESEPKKKGRGGWQRRNEKLTRNWKNAESRAEAAERLAAELKAQLAAKPAEQQTPAKTVPDGRPKLSDFETPEEWAEALTDWKLEQRDAKVRQAAVEDETKERQQTYRERLEAAKSKHDDWEEVADEIKANGMNIPLIVQDAILESDVGPEITYYLAKNRDVTAKLMDMSPAAAAKEIGRIEARLSPETKDAPKDRPKSNAPPPIKPLGGSTKHVASVDDPNISIEEYYEIRKAQRRGR